ncbi:PREDICTED: amyloid beta A4 precursor protein-binding family B member 2-like [Branchiostoma belcheri]|uniref:Amyloid beta A4 precursor protein-binding family B member 2-like n=1 Tax=Branchiostoma belcheri TaxID=7741 RepID=A0A6P5AXN0_BRABE|nr:PREDICTED: amyloid beta A4 precursor protein-binding family B member 2-like [Branchiostoma belcheri]
MGSRWRGYDIYRDDNGPVETVNNRSYQLHPNPSALMSSTTADIHQSDRTNSNVPPNTLNLQSSLNDAMNAATRTNTTTTGGGKSRKKYATTDLSSMGIPTGVPEPTLTTQTNNVTATDELQRPRAGSQSKRKDADSPKAPPVNQNANQPAEKSRETTSNYSSKRKGFLDYYADLEKSANTKVAEAWEKQLPEENTRIARIEEKLKQPPPEGASLAEPPKPELGPVAKIALERCEQNRRARVSSDIQHYKAPVTEDLYATSAKTKVEADRLERPRDLPVPRSVSDEGYDGMFSSPEADHQPTPSVDDDDDDDTEVEDEDDDEVEDEDIIEDVELEGYERPESAHVTSPITEAEDSGLGENQPSPKLPPGWEKVTETEGISFYWHIPTGTTQWDPPPPPSEDDLKPRADRKDDEEQVEKEPAAATPDQDSSLQEFQKATLTLASKTLRNDSVRKPPEEEEETKTGAEKKCYAVRSLGWVEMAEEDLAPGRSSMAVNNCIRQLSYRKTDIRDTAGIWGEGKDMFMVLEGEDLKLLDPTDRKVLHVQPIPQIRVWGVGRDNGRDFAYVARDKVTHTHKCHVFRCDTPAKAIANALHEICTRVMTEKRRMKEVAMAQQRQQADRIDTPKEPAVLEAGSEKVDFPTPKNEAISSFQVLYVGSTPVAKPSGIKVLNEAIDYVSRKNEDDWIPATVDVAPSAVTVKSKETREQLTECRVRFLSFLGIGRNANGKMFGYIHALSATKFEAHVFHCEPTAAALSKAVEGACQLRYQKVIDARPEILKSSKPQAPAENKRWSSVKSGFQNMLGLRRNSRVRQQPPDEPPTQQ